MGETLSDSAIEPTIRARILDGLAAIEREEGARVLIAVESGSRAWGFPSPDSDYDVRFLYVKPRDWYLSIRPGRDVIERPIVDLMDYSGWDMRKALGLLVGGNPALLEWLASPIRYRVDDWVHAALLRHAELIDHRAAALQHYASLARGQYARLIDGRSEVELKKYFYALRPALALRWLRQVPAGRVPMALPALLRDLDLPSDLRDAIAELLRRKAETREMGDGPRLPAVDRLIEEEIAAAPDAARKRARTTSETIAAFDALFRDILRRYA
jgi:uncharacterized protein